MATRILTEEDKRALEARMGAAPQGVSRGLRLLTEVDRQELERKIDEAGPNIQLEALTLIPTKESQAVTAPEGTAYDRIRVDPIPDRFQDVSGVTAQPEQVLDGVYFVDSTGERKEGRIPARSAGDLTVSGLTVSVPAGYYGTDAYKSVDIPDTGDSDLTLVTANVTSTKGTQEVTPNAGEAFSKVIVNPIPDKYQDVSGVTAQPEQVLDGYKFVDKTGELMEGTIPIRSEADLTATSRAVTVPAGFYETAVTKEVDLNIAEGAGVLFTNEDVKLVKTDSKLLATAVMASEHLLPAGATIEFQMANSRFGNAKKTDVVYGATFTSENGLNISGTKPVDQGNNTVAEGTAEADSLAQLHYWEKSAVTETITEETVSDYQLWYKSSYGTQSVTYGFSQYAQEIAIEDGALVLVNPQSRDSVANSEYDTVLPGKYLQSGTTFYRVPADAVISTYQTTGATRITVDRAFKMTLVSVGGRSIVVSDDSSLFPTNGEQDGYTYVYQGTLNAAEKEAVIQALTVTENGTYTVPAGVDGYGPVTVNVPSEEVPAVEQATPTISVSASGLITASATQEAGKVSAGTKSATKQLTTQAEQEITPGTSDKEIPSGRYLTGTQTIRGDSNLVAENIKKGVSIFGVAGSHVCEEGVTLPSIDEAVLGAAPDLAEGKKLIGADGEVVTGTLADFKGAALTAAALNESYTAGEKYLQLSYIWSSDKIVRKDYNVRLRTKLENLGAATAADVRAGVTFTSKEGFNIPGTMEASSGGAELPDIAEDVLGKASDLAKDKQLIGPNGEVITGTLAETGSLPGTFSHEFVGENIKNTFNVSDDCIVRAGTELDVGYVWGFELGTAAPEDVRAGVTFTSMSGQCIPGTMEASSGGVTLPEGAVVVQKVLAAQASQQIGSGYSLSITYGDTLEINDSIALAFSGTTQNLSNISATTDFSVLLGKYVRSGTTTGTFYYIPEDATFTVSGQSYSKTLTCDKAQKVSMQKVSV